MKQHSKSNAKRVKIAVGVGFHKSLKRLSIVQYRGVFNEISSESLMETDVNKSTSSYLTTSQLDDIYSQKSKLLLARIRFSLGHKLCRRLDPEDIFQDSYLSAHKLLTIHTFKISGSYLGWIIAIIDNCIRDARKYHLQCKKRSLLIEVRLNPEFEDNQTASVSTEDLSPSRLFERQHCFTELMEVLKELTPIQREAILMVRLGGYNVGDAARQLKVSPGKISVALCRGSSAIRKIAHQKQEQLPYLAEEFSRKIRELTRAHSHTSLKGSPSDLNSIADWDFPKT